MVSSAISTLLTYTGIFRQNGHDFVYFIFCYVFFFVLFFSFIFFMKKSNNCSSVDFIFIFFNSLLYGYPQLKANILSSPQ